MTEGELVYLGATGPVMAVLLAEAESEAPRLPMKRVSPFFLTCPSTFLRCLRFPRLRFPPAQLGDM